MAYIGAQPRLGNFQACDAISTSATDTFNLLVGGVAIFPQTAQHCLVSLNGVLQAPISSYTISGSTIVFASALTSSDSIDFITILGDTLDLGTPSDGTVATASVAANAITGAKLNTDTISAQTALTAEPADTDEFLVSDAGVLKRIDYSLIKGGGITVADQWRITSTFTYPSSGSKVLASNWERIDTDSPGYIGTAMTESSGIFTFPSTGKYLIHFFTNIASAAASNYVGFYIEATEDNSSYSYLAANWDSADAANRNMAVSAQGLFDVTNTTTHKIRFNMSAAGSDHEYGGNTAVTYTGATFIRLGDT